MTTKLKDASDNRCDRECLMVATTSKTKSLMAWLLQLISFSGATPKIEQLSYRDVLHTRERIGTIYEMYDLAKQLGYPYFLWDDRVYAIKPYVFSYTGLNVGNVI